MKKIDQQDERGASELAPQRAAFVGPAKGSLQNGHDPLWQGGSKIQRPRDSLQRRPVWDPCGTLCGPVGSPWRFLGGSSVTLGGSLEDPWWTLVWPVGRTAENNLPTDIRTANVCIHVPRSKNEYTRNCARKRGKCDCANCRGVYTRTWARIRCMCICAKAAAVCVHVPVPQHEGMCTNANRHAAASMSDCFVRLWCWTALSDFLVRPHCQPGLSDPLWTPLYAHLGPNPVYVHMCKGRSGVCTRTCALTLR